MSNTHGSIMMLNSNGTGEEYGSSRKGWTPVYGKGVNLLDNSYFIGGGSQQGGGNFRLTRGEKPHIQIPMGIVSIVGF